MSVRPRVLPDGWYPDSKDQIKRTFSEWETESSFNATGISGIVPHAGWAFSGDIAYNVIRNLAKNADTVAVIGGHLSSKGGILAGYEDSFYTPLGNIENNKLMLKDLEEYVTLQNDLYADNTIEINLPIVKYFFPHATMLYLRAEPGKEAVELGNALYTISERRGSSLICIGSTDLTHYGPSYGFTPKGIGPDAERWVREVNDKDIVDAMCKLDADSVIKQSIENKSACSAGAAVTALSFAKRKGVTEGRLIEYATSGDKMPSMREQGSFVGYAGIIFE